MGKALSSRVEYLISIRDPHIGRRKPTSRSSLLYMCHDAVASSQTHTPTKNKMRNKEVNVEKKKTFVRNNLVIESVLFKMCFFFLQSGN